MHNFKNISEQVNTSTAKVEQILPTLKDANMVRVDENIKSSIKKVAVKLGDDVANAFAKKVRSVLDDVNHASGRVSCPANIAMSYMLVMTLSILLLIMVVVANITMIHSGVLWIVLGGGLGMEILMLLFIWYLHRKGWV